MVPIGQNSVYYVLAVIALALWSIPWKAMALWKSARRGDVGWFIFFVLVNTVGIAEIVYLMFITKKKIPGIDSQLKRGGAGSESDNGADTKGAYARPEIDTDEYTREEKEAEHEKAAFDLRKHAGDYDGSAFNLRKLRMQKRLEEGLGEYTENSLESPNNANTR